MVRGLSLALMRWPLLPLLFFAEWPWLRSLWDSVVAAATWGFEFLRGLGAPGMFVIAIFDSSLLSIPEINDILVVSACIADSRAVLYYPFIAAAGSVVGCLILFHIARRGGRALLHRRFSPKNVARVEDFFARYGALALIIPSLCPPPTPFKIFVTTAGALQYPRRRFIAAILFGRFTRYTIEGILAVMYGQLVLTYLKEEPAKVALGVFAIVLVSFVVFRLISHWLNKRQEQSVLASGD